MFVTIVYLNIHSFSLSLSGGGCKRRAGPFTRRSGQQGEWLAPSSSFFNVCVAVVLCCFVVVLIVMLLVVLQVLSVSPARFVSISVAVVDGYR